MIYKDEKIDYTEYLKKKRPFTLKMFMEDYKGFKWERGTVALVIDGKPFICTRGWKFLIDKYAGWEVRNWTHDENFIIVVLSD